MYKINYKIVYNRKNRLQRKGATLIQIECYQTENAILFLPEFT